MKMLKFVVPELILVVHQTALHVVHEALHNNRHEILWCLCNYIKIFCMQQAAGSI